MQRCRRKRMLVDAVRSEWQVSIRRACDALEFDRSTYHYKCRRSGQAALEQKIKEICHVRIRYGYRRVHVLLRREGWRHGQNKTRRIYRELGQQLRNNTPKRGVKAKLRDDRRPATRSNQTWAMDFVHDQLASGHKLRVLTIIDTFSRFSPGLGSRQQKSGIAPGPCPVRDSSIVVFATRNSSGPLHIVCEASAQRANAHSRCPGRGLLNAVQDGRPWEGCLALSYLSPYGLIGSICRVTSSSSSPVRSVGGFPIATTITASSPSMPVKSASAISFKRPEPRRSIIAMTAA